MTVEFDEFSHAVPPGDGDEPAEALPPPPPGNRRRIAIASAGGAVLLTGAVVAALVTTSGSASASPAALAAAASSAASSSSAAKPAPTGTGDRRGPGGRGGFGALGPLGSLGLLAGKPVLFGTVKSVNGSTILITDLQGFTRTIITSSTTTYKNGASAKPAVGSKLLAVGTIAKDGTDLDATSISGLPAGFGAPGGGHPGFRGGPGGSGGPGGGTGTGGSGRPFVRPTGTPPSGFHPGYKPTGTPTAKTTA